MSAINALTSGTPAAAAGTSSRFTELSSEDFIKIIFTELQNQDPFKPNDSGALLEQLNSIRSIESDIQLSKDLESIVFQNQLATAGNLIGKRVAGLTADNERVGGTVKSVARSGDAHAGGFFRSTASSSSRVNLYHLARRQVVQPLAVQQQAVRPLARPRHLQVIQPMFFRTGVRLQAAPQAVISTATASSTVKISLCRSCTDELGTPLAMCSATPL